jgi:hypothetical protein
VRRFCVGIGLLVTLSACKELSTSPAASDFAIIVTSPNVDVFLGASEPMTATASDGRALAGTWGTDNPSAVTVNATTGLAAAVSSGQANVFYIADGRQGAKLIRALPNLAGTFTGAYLVTSCSATGQMASSNVCNNAPQGTQVPFTFIFAQTGPVLTGRVLVVGTDTVPAFATTIGVGGDVSVNGMVIAPGGFTVDTTWQISQRTAGVITGTIAQVWTAPGFLTGQANVTGSISTINKTATVGD